jgi:O-antigen ligase
MLIHHHYRSPSIKGFHVKAAIWGLSIYVLVNFISVLIPHDISSLHFSARDHSSFYATVITISVLLAVRSQKMIKHLILILLAVSGVFFGVELVTVSWWDSFSPGIRFVGSSHVHPNILGMTLLVLPSLCIGTLALVKGRVGRMALGATTVVFTFFLFLVKSRSCLFVFGLVNLPLSVLIFGRRGKLRSKILVVTAIILLIVPLVSYIWMNHATEERRSSRSIYGRFEAWQTSMKLAVDGPWYRTLIGHGSYDKGFQKLIDHYGRNSRQFPGEPGHAHNSYLQTFVESGFLGLAGQLLFLVSLFLGLIHGYRERDENSHVSGILLVSMSTILAIGFLDYSLNSISGKLHYGIIAMAAASVSQRSLMDRTRHIEYK